MFHIWVSRTRSKLLIGHLVERDLSLVFPEEVLLISSLKECFSRIYKNDEFVRNVSEIRRVTNHLGGN